MPQCFILHKQSKGGVRNTKERASIDEEQHRASMGETEIHDNFLGRRGDGVSGERY